MNDTVTRRLYTPPTIADDYLGPVNGEANLPAIVDAAAFLAQPIHRPPELVAGMLHKGSKLVFGGGSKSFKTWSLLDLGLSVATGTEWLGFATTQGRVIFLNFEIQPAFFQDRINSIVQAKGIRLPAGRLDVWNLRGHAAGYQTLLPRVIERIGEDYSLVVLDPIYKVYGGADENSAAAVAGLLNGIEEVTVETGAAVAFGAHYSKGNQSGKEAIDRISGSGVFARDPDSILNFTRHEETDCFTVESTLRNLKPVDPFVARWCYPLMRRDDALDPARLRLQNSGRKREHSPKQLLKAIVETTADSPVSVSGWAEVVGIPRRTLSDYLAGMRQAGYIQTVGDGLGARQFITEKGRKLVDGEHP